MGSIIKFVAVTKSNRRRTALEGKSTTTCEIVIFPGVRYERWSEDSSKPVAQPKRGKRRRSGTS